MNLDFLIKPKSMVIVGVTDKPDVFGNRLAQCAIESKISNQIYFVNPGKEQVLGKTCFQNIEDIPVIPDCAAICLNCHLAGDILERAGRMGIKAAIIYASGYGEEHSSEGRKREERLVQIARTYNMSVLGPNCGGMINCCDQISAFALARTKKDTGAFGISIVSQSGGMVANVYNNPCTNISYGISVGNASVISLEDCMEYVLADAQTHVLALYMEGTGNPARFVEVLKKAALLRKPVVILKGGRSKKGAVATASHTGSMAGSAAVFEAVARRYGAILVHSENELQSTAIALASLKGSYPSGNGLVSVNLSGACATLCADLCEDLNIRLLEFSDGTREKLTELTGQHQVHNPLDATPSLLTTPEHYADVMETAGMEDGCDVLLVTTADFVQSDRLSNQTLKALRVLRDRGFDKPVILMPGKEGTRSVSMWSELDRMRCPIVLAGCDGYKIIRYMLDFFCYDLHKHCLECGPWEHTREEKEAEAFSEWESKRMLEEHGFTLPPQFLVNSREELKQVLEQERLAFPMVLKICSRDIPHKTDAGGVALNLESKEDVEKAFDRIMKSCMEFAPKAKIDGVLVSAMAPEGMEMILGIKNDNQFGPMLLAGLGGIFTDIFQDTVLSPCPVSAEEAYAMLESLKAYKMLNGYRGMPPVDIPAIIDLMVKLSHFAYHQRKKISEFDINPLVVYEKGAKILDALAYMWKQ